MPDLISTFTSQTRKGILEFCFMNYTNPPYGYFYHLNSPFCEGTLIGIDTVDAEGYPSITEIANSISSLAFSLFGIWCIGMEKTNKDFLMRLCCYLLISTGIGSTLYHATFWYGFGILDGLGMELLAAVLQLVMVETMVVFFWNGRSSQKKIVLYVIQCLFIFWVIFMIQQKTLWDDWSLGDNQLLGVPIAIIIACFLIWIILIYGVKYKARNADSLKLLVMGIVSVVSIAFAFGMHSLPCDEISVAFIPHAFWHVFSGYSVCCIIVYLYGVRKYQFNYSVKLSWYLKVLPKCEIIDGKENHVEVEDIENQE